MCAYGTRVVAGVTPGRGGQSVLRGIPVYDSVREAADEHSPDASVLFVPAPMAKDAALEALDADVKTVVIITEHVPVHDVLCILAYARVTASVVVGPNTFGVVSAARSKIGIAPGSLFCEGVVGIVARSGTLTYEIASDLSRNRLGQSTVVGIGGDPVVGLSFKDVLMQFESDRDTQVVVLVGEIGGSAEEDACEMIEQMTKPVVAYIAGKTAPAGTRMGHAGAIIERGRGGYEQKVAALRRAGAQVVPLAQEVSNEVRRLLGERAVKEEEH